MLQSERRALVGRNVIGDAELEIHPESSAAAQEAEVAFDIGIASGHLVERSTTVKR